MQTLANLIDGRLVPAARDRYLDVFEPATGAVFARCPDSDAADVDAAVAAAMRAAPGWAATTIEER
ncbi:MAG: aldehyde dehydrogenase family protein, partial [Dokdonella sp.]